MRIENNMIKADEGKFIHRIGDSAYFTSAYLLPNDTIDNFEQVDSIPEEPDGPTYEERVNARIREEYSIDEEFAIQRQRDSKPDEFRAYFDRVEQIKSEERNRK